MCDKCQKVAGNTSVNADKRYTLKTKNIIKGDITEHEII